MFKVDKQDNIPTKNIMQSSRHFDINNLSFKKKKDDKGSQNTCKEMVNYTN